MKFLSRALPSLFFLLLIVFSIFIPFFRQGFIFSYDGLFFYPKIVYKLHYLLPNQTYFLFFLDKLSYLIPTWIIQRLIWMMALFIGALGCFHLFGKSSRLIGYLAGIFFIFNPFVYERMIMGQTTVVLGFSLYPWVVLSLIKFFLEKKYSFLIVAGVLYGIAVLLFPHSLFILGLLVLAIFLYFLLKEKNFLKIVLSFLLLFIFVTVINLNWLLPSLREKNGMSELSTQFSQSDFTFYATSEGKINNIWFNVLTLNGHWGERYKFFNYHLDSYLSRFSTVLILAFILLGIYLGLKNKKEKALSLLALSSIIIALILAIGKAHPFTEFLTRPLYQYFPFYNGLREPQKWAALILLAYIFFFSVSFRYFLKKAKKTKTIKILLAFLLFLPIINAHQMLWGFNNQLKVGDFPKSWYGVNDYLNNQEGDFKVLFLPWRFYINLSFASREIINPALSFFDKFTFIGSDINVNNTYYQVYEEDLRILDDQMGFIMKGRCPDLVTFKRVGVKYILLVMEDNWESYAAIGNCPNLELVKKYPKLFLFQTRE